MSLIDRLRDLVVPIVEDFDLYLFDLDYAGGRVTVTIDTPESSDPGEGVDSGTLTLVTRQISRELDAEDPVPSGYTLEVTTPGVERRLRRPEHYVRSVGETITVKLHPGQEIGGERRVRGVLAEAADTDFSVRTDDGDTITVDYRSVSKARTVFEWGPSPKPGNKPDQRSNKDRSAANAKKATNHEPTAEGVPQDAPQDKAGAQ